MLTPRQVNYVRTKLITVQLEDTIQHHMYPLRNRFTGEADHPGTTDDTTTNTNAFNNTSRDVRCIRSNLPSGVRGEPNVVCVQEADLAENCVGEL